MSGTRRETIAHLMEPLRPGTRVALSTHINADGDGCGSQAGFARLLRQMGVEAWIANPTPWPRMFGFLLGDDVQDRSDDGEAALREADALVVLDIADLQRLGQLADTVRSLSVPVLVIDHHQPGDEPIEGRIFSDTGACATGELVFDIAQAMGLEITPDVATSLYVAILTDTGGFRFSNTTPRAHAVAARLLDAGVDPEEMYRRIYASVPIGKLRLLRDALESLEWDEDAGLAWISVEAGATQRYQLRSEDLDGLVEHPRSILGVRLALFFRDLGHGKVKVSFRSSGSVDANRLARRLGGGGHVKASGALVSGTLTEVRDRVVAAAREFLAEQPEDPARPRITGRSVPANHAP